MCPNRCLSIYSYEFYQYAMININNYHFQNQEYFPIMVKLDHIIFVFLSLPILNY